MPFKGLAASATSRPTAAEAEGLETRSPNSQQPAGLPAGDGRRGFCPAVPRPNIISSPGQRRRTGFWGMMPVPETFRSGMLHHAAVARSKPGNGVSSDGSPTGVFGAALEASFHSQRGSDRVRDERPAQQGRRTWCDPRTSRPAPAWQWRRHHHDRHRHGHRGPDGPVRTWSTQSTTFR